MFGKTIELKSPFSARGKPQSGALFSSLDKTSLCFIVVALFLLTAPLDLPQLVCGFIGAVVYASLQLLPNLSRLQPPKGYEKAASKCGSITKDTCHGTSTPSARALPSLTSVKNAKPAVPPCARPTAMPIAAPVFKTDSFNTQVDELVDRIMPTPACDQAVEDLTRIVKRAIQKLVPEVEVCGFASGNLGGAMAYGVAVPEVEIVANARPTELTKRLQGRFSQNSRQRSDFSVDRLDIRKLQKSSIRVCTSLLVAAGFKFRRSSFRTQEPKVTLLAPANLGVFDKSVPVDFSVNNITPLYNMALLTECGQMEPRAKALILLVKRWAKDRGVCHASKGHLPPYAWSLLVIYFLQVGVPEEGPLLPPLEGFAVSSGLMSKPAKAAEASSTRWTPPKIKRPPSAEAAPKKAVGELFQQFMRFYTEDVDWRKEAVSVRLGRRESPNLALDIHIVLNDDGTTAVSPIIEDPFNPKNNVGDCTNSASLQRFHEEFARARDFLSRGISLTDLLEPWRPPESELYVEKQEQEMDDDN
mmetsp:Transcript_44670/g.78567  ORF Transcript_44670/g.78567 Transcript_44670/m.78567 type:complete len:529 (+) Transcript_44670:161-1747(+)